jgi:hypothetical protein
VEGEPSSLKYQESSTFDNDSPEDAKHENRCSTLLLTFVAKGQICNRSCE